MLRREMMGGAFALGLPAASGAATPAPATHIQEDLLHGRRALVIRNNRMRLAVLPGGGFIADAGLISSDPAVSVNPMRVPHYRTIDPHTYDVARHGALYGTGIQRRLMSGYMGHFTCFPQFAASSPAEFAQDYGQHGELIAVEWSRRAGAAPDELVMGAELPMTQYGFERRVVLPADETVAYVTETAENLVPYDRPAQWVQHTTFGPPFIAMGKTMADGSVDRVVLGRGATATTTDFPIGRDAQGGALDYRPFRGATALWLMRRSGKNYFTLYNTDLRVLIGYVYDAETDPWLLDYQENMRVTEVPWDGKVVMRGLCFGDSATSGVRNAVTQGPMLGVPTYSWFEARARRAKRYAIFLTEIPAGFKGVANVEAAPGAITVTERETGRTTVLKSSRMW